MTILCFAFPGPELWGEVSAHCDGQSQSPVNIVTRKVVTDRLLSQFELTGYNQVLTGTITNTGYTGNNCLSLLYKCHTIQNE